jgi:hypothetical protein
LNSGPHACWAGVQPLLLFFQIVSHSFMPRLWSSWSLPHK